MSELNKIKEKIMNCLQQLYSEEGELFKKNKGRGVCERCLVFRFAYYLQKEFPELWVDCDYNAHFNNGVQGSGKVFFEPNGKIGKKFVDVILHKRKPYESDFACFEIKKWNNSSKDAISNDLRKLKQMKSLYKYKYAFHLTLGKHLEQTKLTPID